jgi:hypothetical protein
MDPTTTCCPNLACPARGQIGQGNIGMHSRKDQRFLCAAYRTTFSTTKGTAFYRLRTAAETVTLVVTLLAHDCPPQAIVAAFGFFGENAKFWAVALPRGLLVLSAFLTYFRASITASATCGHSE